MRKKPPISYCQLEIASVRKGGFNWKIKQALKINIIFLELLNSFILLNQSTNHEKDNILSPFFCMQPYRNSCPVKNRKDQGAAKFDKNRKDVSCHT